MCKKGAHPFPALQDAIDTVFATRIGDVSGRGKLAADMREIWMMQPRFEKRVGATPMSLVGHLRFRAGFDFLRLRAEVGEVDVALADWWQEFSTADDAVREDLVQQVREQLRAQPKTQSPKPVREPRVQKSAPPAVDAKLDDAGLPGMEGESANPARKRRRRRRTGGAGGGIEQ